MRVGEPEDTRDRHTERVADEERVPNRRPGTPVLQSVDPRAVEGCVLGERAVGPSAFEEETRQAVVDRRSRPPHAIAASDRAMSV